MKIAAFADLLKGYLTDPPYAEVTIGPTGNDLEVDLPDGTSFHVRIGLLETKKQTKG